MNLILGAAKTDPDIRVRAEALRFLAAMPGDQAISTIEEMARTPGNEQLQRAAIAALGRSDSPRARQSLRALVEKTDLDPDLRMTALSSIDADKSPDNAAYLRGVYPRLETPRLKAAASAPARAPAAMTTTSGCSESCAIRASPSKSGQWHCATPGARISRSAI
jgi:HEAT repeat protein